MTVDKQVRAVLEQALDALALQPRSGVSTWHPADARQRVAAKRAIQQLLVQIDVERAVKSTVTSIAAQKEVEK